MKKLPALVLTLCMLIGVCGAKASEAGETAEVSFSMLTNPGKAYSIVIMLEYDHNALKLVPNDIFHEDRKAAQFNENLSAVFRVREDAEPGSYPVVIRVIEAADYDANLVREQDFPVYSGAVITVERPPTEVPVYYYDADTGELMETETVSLPAGWTGTVTGNAPEGYVITGGQSMQVTVSEDGQAMPPVVTFWLAVPTPIPTTIWTPTRTPAPVLVKVGEDVLAAPGMPGPSPTPEPVEAGDYITFGHYKQDNNTDNGKEPIEWLVLEVRGSEALVISKYALDAQPYNTDYKSVTWETCSLRVWLNGEFLNNAFTAEEQRAIIMTTADNSAGQGYSEWNTDGGNDTKDRIFLLSYAEAWSYFGSDSVRQSEATRYAEGRGAYTSGGKCWWWLRSPGFHQRLAARVYTDGSLNSHGVFIDSGCVRPALWINPDSGIF